MLRKKSRILFTKDRLHLYCASQTRLNQDHESTFFTQFRQTPPRRLPSREAQGHALCHLQKQPKIQSSPRSNQRHASFQARRKIISLVETDFLTPWFSTVFFYCSTLTTRRKHIFRNQRTIQGSLNSILPCLRFHNRTGLVQG